MAATIIFAINKNKLLNNQNLDDMIIRPHSSTIWYNDQIKTLIKLQQIDFT